MIVFAACPSFCCNNNRCRLCRLMIEVPLGARAWEIVFSEFSDREKDSTSMVAETVGMEEVEVQLLFELAEEVGCNNC